MDNESSTSRKAGITGFFLGQQKPGKAVAFYTHTHTHTHTKQRSCTDLRTSLFSSLP